MRDDTFKAILFTLVISALLTVAFTFVMRNIIERQETFTELYFQESNDLPHELRINETHNISFAISNNELTETNYTYEITSKITNIRENITLSPGEKTSIYLSITPTDRGWVLNFTSNQQFNNESVSWDNALLARDNDFRMIINNISLKNLLPISHNITGFGSIYHTNLTRDELKEKPFNKFLSEEKTSEDYRYYKSQNITLFIKDDELQVNIQETINHYITEKEPFTVELYQETTENTKKHEIYFWYEVM